VVGGFRIEAEQEVAQERIDHGAEVAGFIARYKVWAPQDSVQNEALNLRKTEEPVTDDPSQLNFVFERRHSDFRVAETSTRT
jgi:hypothetical protein